MHRVNHSVDVSYVGAKNEEVAPSYYEDVSVEEKAQFDLLLFKTYTTEFICKGPRDE